MTPRLERLESRRLLTGLTPVQVRNDLGLGQVYREYGAAGEGAGVTIAVVVAFDASGIATEIARYDHRYHLPAVDLAVSDLGTDGVTSSVWSEEAFTDVALIHEIAPLARILLVEADDTGYDELMAADQYAASLPGVVVVNNSWGGPEFPTEFVYDTFLGQPGVTFVAATGDLGTVNYPAASPDMIAVGGVLITGPYKAPLAQANGGRSLYYAGRTTPDVTMAADTSIESGTSPASALFAGLMGDVQGIRIARRENPLGTLQMRSLMDAAAGNRSVFVPVKDEAGVGMPKGLGFVRAMENDGT